MRVLLVDDNPEFRALTRALVSAETRFEVVGEVGTGEDAVTAARDLNPDLIVMDVCLPGIDGVESTRRILAEEPRRAVVLVSARPAEDQCGDGLADCGARGFVRKEDLDPATLLALAG